MKIIGLRLAFLLLALCTLQLAWSQERSFKHELILQNDNDVYLFTAQDRYYTNGIQINYRFALKSDTSKTLNRVMDIEIGQKMYNGVNLSEKSQKWDRPFAGYFYLSGELNQYYRHNQVLSLKVELGQIGPQAKGKEVQEVIHRVFNIYEVSGWEEQLPNTFGLDLGIKYQYLLYTSLRKNFDISGLGSATLGMNHTNASIGVPIRWGHLRSFDESLFTKGHVQSKTKAKEFFLYYIPSVTYQVYNATTQGGLIKHSTVRYPYTIEKMVMGHKIGAMVATGRSSIGLSYIFQSRESKELLYNTHQYGSLFYGLRF